MQRPGIEARQVSQSNRQTVNIRPGVSVLSVLMHLNYRPWYALAEFVDNSIQSFLVSRQQIAKSDGTNCRLSVAIEIDEAGRRIVIRDNAGGIALSDFPRSFRPAQLPPDRGGLAEFGMGMKSAACWFAPRWTVRTKAVGELIERTIEFDITRIVRNELEEIDIADCPATASDHFTEIILHDPYHMPVGRTTGKIREHLAEIYRVFIRDGTLELTCDRQVLCYQEPDILFAARYSDRNEPIGEPVTWKRDIDFDFGTGLRVRGFAALRRQASTSHAGFSLFRRSRLIVGSADEKYRPRAIFGAPNDFVYQRLFGELHLDGFSVSHTKDGFRWEEHEDIFVELLKEELDKEALPLLRQARNYRSRPARQEIRAVAERVNASAATAIERHVPALLPELTKPSEPVDAPAGLGRAELAATRTVRLRFEEREWQVVIELTDDRGVSDWLSIADSGSLSASAGSGIHTLAIRISVVHPFMERFAGCDPERMESLVRMAAALAIAETASRQAGVRGAGGIRTKMNRLLRDALSKPTLSGDIL
jgi:hypothetical protein